MGLFSKLTDSLSKTRKGFVEKIFDAFTGKEIDDDLYDELEELLIQGDVGVNTAVDLVERLREREKTDKLNIILMVGVNGVGKTTSIGKLAYLLKQQGHKVILGAGDTFRAAAAEQLKVWGDRVGCDVISHQEGADPAAVVFDAIAAAKSRKCDVLIVDTAGRLQNKSNLMNELSKMRKVIDREAPGCLKEVLLVLDATTGQNAISQAKIFGDATGVTGVILTKLDGTAKGGVVIGIRSEFDLPVKLIGTGEAIDNLEYFDAKAFGEALFAGEDSLKDKVEDAVDEIRAELADVIEDVQEDLETLQADITEEVQDTLEDLQEVLQDTLEEVQEKAEEAQEKVEEKVDEAKKRKKGFFGWGGRK